MKPSTQGFRRVVWNAWCVLGLALLSLTEVSGFRIVVDEGVTGIIPGLATMMAGAALFVGVTVAVLNAIHGTLATGALPASDAEVAP